jgi:diadenosine tetraphosphatase ApaH/serine/threonine PP2A family protein phosphatase
LKIAILGDIHANLEALSAVLEDAADTGAALFACTGDLVGYNANPHECVEMIRRLGCPVVMGNHDEEAVNCGVIEGMSERARLAMEWTRENLTDEDKRWLADLPAVQQVHGFTLVHASLECPSSWTYVLDRFDAMSSFDHQNTRLCFYGHTHTPVMYVKAGESIIRESVLNPVCLAPGRKYMINTGSVGQPRDGDARASYALYDTEAGEVAIRRVRYDLDTALEKTKRGPAAPRGG